MLIFLIAICLLFFLLHIGIGSYLWLRPDQVLSHIFRGDLGGEDPVNAIVWRLRLPRAIGCVMTGAILGMVGSAFQAIFRNPLADPYIVGVSSGSAIGGAIAITLGVGQILGGLGVVAASFVGGILSLVMVLSLATRKGILNISTLLLAGVVLGAMLSSLLTLILLASGQDANQVLRWLLGSMTPMFWNRDAVLTTTLLIGGTLMFRQTRALNAFAMGEDTAQRLGVDVHRLKRMLLLTGTAMTAVTVGSVGIVAFLGLLAPHIARLALGVDWRRSLLGSALTGATVLLLADLLAQRAFGGIELPVGAVTALLGAPSLIVLMRRRQASAAAAL